MCVTNAYCFETFHNFKLSYGSFTLRVVVTEYILALYTSTAVWTLNYPNKEKRSLSTVFSIQNAAVTNYKNK